MPTNAELTHADIYRFITDAGGAYVVYRPVGGIGDAGMIIPTLVAIKEEIGDELLIVICIEYVRPIFAHCPAIDYIFSFTEHERDLGHHYECVKYLEKLGCIVYKLYEPCPGSQYEADVSPSKDKYIPSEISISRQQLFAKACDVEFDPKNYVLELSEEEIATPKELGFNDRYIIVQPRSHDKSRDYPMVLVNALLANLVKIGKREDFDVVTIDSVINSKVKGVKSICRTHLDKILGIINGAMLLIGPDSSGVHMAGILRRRIFAIFGPTNPLVRLKYHRAYWLQPFNGCSRMYCWYAPCKFKFCLTTLKPKDVVTGIMKVINEETDELCLGNSGEENLLDICRAKEG